MRAKARAQGSSSARRGSSRRTVRGVRRSGGRRPQASAASAQRSRVLVIDVGGTNVKVLATGEIEPRKFPSGPELTPGKLVTHVRQIAKGWRYDRISIGFPGVTGRTGPIAEPGNLGQGWVGFDFAAAFGCPVKIANDAAMQALGSYDGGRMLFIGLGTGVGGAIVVGRTIIPLELGDLPWRRDRETLSHALGTPGLQRAGARAWRRMVEIAAHALMKVFLADHVVLGGGNAKKLRDLPAGLRIGNTRAAFRGGFRLWSVDDIPTQAVDVPEDQTEEVAWRLL